MNQLLTIVIPVHNEEQVLPVTVDRLRAMLPQFREQGLRTEIVFVNDGSSDRSPDMLDEFVQCDPHIRAVHLARNFGHQAAVSTGLALAKGDVVAIMDADLQDPPEQLPAFLAEWRRGYQVVYGVRRKRKEGLAKRFAYWAFYRLYNAMSDLDMPVDSGDFCVLDRSAVDLLDSLPERQRFVRGLRTWIGLKQIGVPYERAAREAGQPSYTFRSLAKLAMDGLINFSTVPLRLVTRFGLLCMLFAIATAFWVVGVTVYEWAHGGGGTPRGWASIACLVLFLSAAQLLSLGILGEYLTRIFLEVKRRPTYLIGRIVEHDPEGSVSGQQPVAVGAPLSAEQTLE